ncbi:MAG: hypothetical protein ACK4TR_01125 [Phenylobacterium sp.]|uniref:hypothetical protein n=1 Tax=Phenylobacterium sp. TaxID=1871053 RepID=UPI00391CC7D6
MLHRTLFAVVLSVFATRAAAAELQCVAEVETDLADKVGAMVKIADDGARTASVFWAPRPDPKQSFGYASVQVVRTVEDIEARRLGSFSNLIAGSMVKVEDVVGQRAVVIASTDRAEPVAVEWKLFAQLMASDDEPGKPVAILGAVPFGRAEPQSRSLVDSVAQSRSLIVSVHDLKTLKPYAKGFFWLTDVEAAEVAMREALVRALEKAEAPDANCEASDAAPVNAAP